MKIFFIFWFTCIFMGCAEASKPLIQIQPDQNTSAPLILTPVKLQNAKGWCELDHYFMSDLNANELWLVRGRIQPQNWEQGFCIPWSQAR